MINGESHFDSIHDYVMLVFFDKIEEIASRTIPCPEVNNSNFSDVSVQAATARTYPATRISTVSSYGNFAKSIETASRFD